MSSYGDFIEKAERDVLTYFKHCPFCFAENSMEFHWSFKDDALSCSKCGAKWHINHGLAGLHWAKLIKINAEGKETELLGKKIDPLYWKQMALNGVRLAEQAGGRGEEEPKEPKPQEPLTKEPENQAPKQTRTGTSEATSEEKEHWWLNPLKYFLHGISFSVLLILLGIVWMFIFATLILIGSFIGLIIGIVVLFFLVGGLNVFLSGIIWDVSARTSWASLFGHGLLLFAVLIVVNIPAYVVNLSSLGLPITVVLSIVYAFIDGFIAKNIAEYFEEEYEEID